MSGRTSQAFTLIELLVVISIVALLSSVVLASLNTARDRGKAAQAAAQLAEIRKVISLYFSDNGVYPCFDHNWNDNAEKTWSVSYLKWPLNPWGTEYHLEHGYPSGNPTPFSVSMRAIGTKAATTLDKLMDDSNPTTGKIRYDDATNRVEYSGMDQTVPFVDCHI